MELIKIIFALALPTLCGMTYVAWALAGDEETPALERVFYGFGLGMGIAAFGGFILGIIGVPFSLASLTLVQIIFTLPCLYLLYRQREISSILFGRTAAAPRPASSPGPWTKAASVAIIIWLLIKAFFVLYEGLYHPFYSHDNWLNWSAGAKMFYYNNGLLLDRDSEYFFARGYRLYLGHPLLTPLLEVWFSSALGEFHESLSKTWSPFFFISLLGVFYYALRREAGSFAALAATFFLSTLPLLTYHATDGYADLPLGLYVLSAMVLIFRYMKGGHVRLLVLAGMLLGVAAFTKNEGLLYCFFAGSSLFLYSLLSKRPRVRALLYYSLGALAILAPWLIFKLSYGIGFGHSDEMDAMSWTGVLHLEIFGVYLKELFVYSNHGVAFAFITVFTIAGLKVLKKGELKYLYLTIAPVILTFLFLYVTTMDFESVTERTAANRNTLTFLPVAFFVAALLALKISGIRKEGEGGQGTSP